jgi:hypothetical protein
LATNDTKKRKGNGNTLLFYLLLFSLKELEILHQERKGQLQTIVMRHLNGIPFHKSQPANNQHTNQSIKPTGKRPLGSPRRRWEKNVKMYLE